MFRSGWKHTVFGANGAVVTNALLKGQHRNLFSEPADAYCEWSGQHEDAI